MADNYSKIVYTGLTVAQQRAIDGVFRNAGPTLSGVAQKVSRPDGSCEIYAGGRNVDTFLATLKSAINAAGVSRQPTTDVTTVDLKDSPVRTKSDVGK